MKTTKMTTAEKIRNLQNMKRTGTLTPADEGFAAARQENWDRNELHDEENPAYLFSGVWTSLLVKIVNGEVDANYIAKVELANRGLDKKGVWVGFAKANKIHGIL